MPPGGRPDVTYSESRVPGGQTSRARHPSHDRWRVVYEGSLTVWIGDARFDVDEGMACLVVPGERAYFEVSAVSDTHHSWLHPWAPDGYPARCSSVWRRSPGDPRVEHAGARDAVAARPPCAPADHQPEIELLLAHRVLYQYIGEAELAEGLGVVYSETVDRALRHIDDHLARPLDLGGIARSAALVSPSHLIRLFHEELGDDPGPLPVGPPRQRAIELLEETGLTLGEIAHRCGFTTTHHFSRRVRAATGMTPAAVRKRAHARGTPSTA